MGRLNLIESLKQKLSDTYYCRKLDSKLLLHAEVEEILDRAGVASQIDVIFSSRSIISIDRKGEIYCNDPKFWELIEEDEINEEDLQRNLKKVLLGKFLGFLTNPRISMSQRDKAAMAISALRSSEDEEVDTEETQLLMEYEQDQEKNVLPFRSKAANEF